MHKLMLVKCSNAFVVMVVRHVGAVDEVLEPVDSLRAISWTRAHSYILQIS